MPFPGFETEEEIDAFMKKLEEIARRAKATIWYERLSGPGKPKLPTQAVILYVLGKRMVDACGGVAITSPEGNVSRLGFYLSIAAGVPLTAESPKATRLACNMTELEAYDLLPDWPLDTPLPKFETNLNKGKTGFD